MTSLANLAFLAGYGLLFVTVVKSAFAVWRRRDLQRIDILVVVASELTSAFLGRTTPYFVVARAARLLAQPYFLLRLVRHFRDVPRILIAATVVLIPVGAAALIIWRPMRPNAVSGTAQFYCASINLYAALALTQEARR